MSKSFMCLSTAAVGIALLTFALWSGTGMWIFASSYPALCVVEFLILRKLEPGSDKRTWAVFSFLYGFVFIVFWLCLWRSGASWQGVLFCWLINIGIRGNLIELNEELYERKVATLGGQPAVLDM